MLKKMLLNLILMLLFWKGGEMDMVALYTALIIYGRRTFEQVPTNLQPAVKEELEALGLNTDGTPM